MTATTNRVNESPGNERRLASNAPQAVNIVSIRENGTADSFQFHPERLQAILSDVKPHYNVKVVSVVGVYRSGKSFLLSWFLRYLNYHAPSSGSDKTRKWYEQVNELKAGAFHWRAGGQRDTTGIWMWNTPFVNHEDRSVLLLVDTQGMFDHQTSKDLATMIFGFATLLSSYQIYNVQCRIDENNLQQLALFSAYAVTALKDQGDMAPFQKLEFLVRDWQNFEEEDEGDLEKMEHDMKDYLVDKFRECTVKDVKKSREDIFNTFQIIQCYGLCHPGEASGRKSFTGRATEIKELFLQLLDHYCTRVFDNVPCKKIHGETITVEQFICSCKTYAEAFADRSKFPEEGTLLEAREKIINHNAKTEALAIYTQAMNPIAGPECSVYLDPQTLEDMHSEFQKRSISTFQAKPIFGNKQNRAEVETELEADIVRKFEDYKSWNNGRYSRSDSAPRLVYVGVLGALGVLGAAGVVGTAGPLAVICAAKAALAAKIIFVIGAAKAALAAKFFVAIGAAKAALTAKFIVVIDAVKTALAAKAIAVIGALFGAAKAVSAVKAIGTLSGALFGAAKTTLAAKAIAVIGGLFSVALAATAIAVVGALFSVAGATFLVVIGDVSGAVAAGAVMVVCVQLVLWWSLAPYWAPRARC